MKSLRAEGHKRKPMLKVRVRKQVERQKKRGKVYNVEQRLIYIPSKAELPDEVYILTPEELKEIAELIPQEKRPSWLAME
ncbi:t26-17p [Thermococcus waiotapuensis]|uniref:T26-17p n=1 Tax=Thermococcus waiotapuensis TaxID=90909 RepID=A0AAE4NW75_9EURY|nr:t26-17p [Thermococcus waiotapuensis]MDV3104269.1 t26-17p [Thermococcus waiotapuensis]